MRSVGEKRSVEAGDGCPRWCVAEHAEDEHPDDRRHGGDVVERALVERVLDFGGPAGAARWTERAEMAQLGLMRRFDDIDAWVRVEIGDARRLELDVASAERLAEAILALVVRARESSSMVDTAAGRRARPTGDGSPASTGARV